MLCLKIFIFFLILNAQCYSYNILVSVVGLAASQNLVMYRLAELLGERGHNVTILNAQVFPNVKKGPLKYSTELSYQIMDNSEEQEDLQLKMQDNAWNVSSGMKIGVVKKMFGILSNGCRNFIQNENKPGNVISELKTRNFDVIVIHLTDFCMFGIAEHLGVKSTIWMSTAFSIDFMSWYSGAPTPTSYVPASMNTMKGPGFFERAKNLFFFTIVNIVFKIGIVNTYTKIFREKYGADFPRFDQLLHQTQLHFINSDQFFEHPRPILHKMIYVGGLTMENSEPLDEKWQKIVNDSDPGVVVFSFGSVTNTTFMPKNIKRAFIEAFKKIKHTVIWRLEGDISEAQKVKNVIVADWLPQRDLIANEKVKALITHGGYNSLTEATYMGVPLIMVPLFGDQHGNCKKVQRLQVGVVLDKQNLTVDSVYEALQAVLYNKTIQENARRMGKMIRKKPFSSKEAAIQWVEYLAEFKTLDELKPEGQKLGLIEYFMVDVLLVIFVLISIFALFATFCSIKLFLFIRNKIRNVKRKQKVQ